MRNLIAFFRRFRVFLVFAFLQVLSLYTYFTYLQFPKTQFLTSTSAVSGSILKVENDITKHFNLSKNNTDLQKENILLRNQLPQSFIKIQGNLVKIDDTLYQQQYDYIPATVINSSCTKRNNYFTLDIGRLEGVKRGDGVISAKGVVGIVHYVSDHFSLVKSVLAENINIDVMVMPVGMFGLLKWDGKDPRYGSIEGISNDLMIKKGSKVVTRGGSGIFPRGIPVGYVRKLEAIEGKSIWNVIIRFSEDYRSLQRVYIVKNLLLEEQKKLENTAPEEENDDQNP